MSSSTTKNTRVGAVACALLLSCGMTLFHSTAHAQWVDHEDRDGDEIPDASDGCPDLADDDDDGDGCPGADAPSQLESMPPRTRRRVRTPLLVAGIVLDLAGAGTIAGGVAMTSELRCGGGGEMGLDIGCSGPAWGPLMILGGAVMLAMGVPLTVVGARGNQVPVTASASRAAPMPRSAAPGSLSFAF